jgi:hypothetical protein
MLGINPSDHHTIQALKDIQTGEFWGVLPLTEGPYSMPYGIQCFHKENRGWSISHAWDFAEVMWVARETLNRVPDTKDKEIVVQNLLAKCRTFEEKSWCICSIINTIFLWVVGYRGDNSFSSMVESLESMVNKEYNDVAVPIRREGSIISEVESLESMVNAEHLNDVENVSASAKDGRRNRATFKK